MPVLYNRMISGAIGLNGTEIKPEREVELINEGILAKAEVAMLKEQIQTLIEVGNTLDHFDRYETKSIDYQTSPFKQTVNKVLDKFENTVKYFYSKYPYLKPKDTE